MDLSIRFLILVMLGLVLGGSAEVSVDQFLSQAEASLQELLNQVQANALNSCDLLSTCNAESTCSRLSCPLTKANTSSYGCQEVLQNPNCKGNCSRRNFDFSRSSLRVPGVNSNTEVSITARQRQEICAQRNLDSLFQKHSNNTNFFRLYFGSVDGTFRIFPGMDESDCGSYDPRLRLWYLASTNVKKAVMVLIDSGNSMAKTNAAGSDSNLATAFSVTESFLNTTTEDDYVNIVTFEILNNVNFSSAHPVLVTNTSTHPDFGIFDATLHSPNRPYVPPGNGDITDAVSKAITSSAGFNNSYISNDYLKVIILITDNKAMEAISNAALPWELIKNNSINVFLYMFGPPNTTTIDASPLASQLCNARGYFKVLDHDTVKQNPLLALEAYYSFVANVYSTYVNNGTNYSILYRDFSDVDNKTFTLSKAAFRSNGEFLGVVGFDIYKTKLHGIPESEIESAIDNRIHSSTTFDSSKIQTTTCFNQTSNRTCNQTADISNIVCSSNFDKDITTVLRKRSCCNICADKPGKLPLALGLGFGLGISALLATLAFIAWCYLRNRRPVPHVFSGDDDDA